MRARPQPFTILSLAVLCTLAFTGSGTAQDVGAPARYQAVREAIEREVENGATPSLAIGVFDEGRILWAEGFGFADVTAGRRADADTVYRLASISKPFTGTALMTLVERGQLALDDPVNRHLAPGGRVRAFRGAADAVTLRRLANHSAGLPTHWSFFYTGSVPPPRDVSIDRYGIAVWPPGSRTNYSNLAFGILDHVIARTAKQSYRDYLVDAVLEPLQMLHTDVGVRPRRGAEHAAVGYVADAAGRFVPVVDYGFDHDGASAVWSSVRDLLAFARFHLGVTVASAEPPPLTAAGRDEMRALRGVVDRNGGGYGVAWRLDRLRGATCQSHSGGMPGVSTQLRLFPELGRAVVVLTNTSARGATQRIMSRALDVLLADVEPAAPVAASRSPAAAKAAGAVAADGPARTRATYRGYVRHHDGPVPLEVTLAGNGATSPRRLEVTFGGRRVRALTSSSVAADGRRVRFAFRARLATTPAFHGTPALAFDLEPLGAGFGGVCAATGDATFRLPQWVHLEPAVEKPADVLRVVSYNVLVGFADHRVGAPYLSGVQRRSAVTAWLAAQRADVVALQEMNGWSDERLRREAVAWGHDHAVVLKPDGYPVALTSSAPIEVVARLRNGLHHGALHVRTHGVDVVVVHVVPFRGEERKRAELERILAAVRDVVASGRPVVLAGDFNAIVPDDVARLGDAARARYANWKWELRDDGAPLVAALPAVLDAGFVDVCAARGQLGDELPLPRIDFVFATEALARTATRADWLPDPRLLERSDHPPVVVDFARPR